jgi:hypothetical protein
MNNAPFYSFLFEANNLLTIRSIIDIWNLAFLIPLTSFGKAENVDLLRLRWVFTRRKMMQRKGGDDQISNISKEFFLK